MDGPREIHDKYRQEGSYDRAVAAIGTLLDAGIPVSVISTLNSENVSYLPQMLSLLRGYDIYAW